MFKKSWAYATIAALESFNLKWNPSPKLSWPSLNELNLISSVSAGSCAGGFPGIFFDYIYNFSLNV